MGLCACVLWAGRANGNAGGGGRGGNPQLGAPQPFPPLHHATLNPAATPTPLVAATGKLPGRSATGLRAKLHRRYCRQVKIARIMGVLSPTQRWEPPHKAPAPRGRPGGTLA